MTATAASAWRSIAHGLFDLGRAAVEAVAALVALALSSLLRAAGAAYSAVPAQRRRPLGLGFGALLLAALYFACTALPTRTAFDAYRRLRGYWGLGGWCEPYSPPRVDYSFAGADGPALSWEGEAEFWRNFPCARSNYRIVLPDAPAGTAAPSPFSSAAATHAAAATVEGAATAVPSTVATAAAAALTDAGRRAAPPGDDCRSTIVTGLFDIGRENWASYPRTKAAYMHDAAVVLSLPNRMVLFTSPDLVDHFVAERRRHGLMDRTIVFGMSVYCIPYAWLLEPVTRIMCSADFAYGSRYSEIPERQQPFYNLIMYAKTLFLKAAATLPQAAVASPYYTWLDLGCHPPMCDTAMAGKCLDPSPWARVDGIRIAMTAPQTPAVWAQDDVTWAKTHHVHMAGTIFGTGRLHAAQLADTFANALLTLMAQGMLCYDQTIFALAFRRWPERFDVFPVFFDNWADIVMTFARQTTPIGELPSEWRAPQGQPQGA